MQTGISVKWHIGLQTRFSKCAGDIQTVLTHAARLRSYFVAVVMIDSKKRDTHGPWAVNASAIRKTATS